jgi:hypothetical protein
VGSFRILHVSDLHFAEVDGTVGFPDVLPPYPRGHHLGLVSSWLYLLAIEVAGADVSGIRVDAFKWDDERDRMFLPAPIPE